MVFMAVCAFSGLTLAKLPKMCILDNSYAHFRKRCPDGLLNRRHIHIEDKDE